MKILEEFDKLKSLLIEFPNKIDSISISFLQSHLPEITVFRNYMPMKLKEFVF